ncbi:MAG: hypothetical protein K6F80_05400 [Oscillospiraceae bacterium]|nr:hypothetical protein [Oscillospiraceae bacterium]
MLTFIIGLVILLVGGLLYGTFCEKIMKPTDAKTPQNLHSTDCIKKRSYYSSVFSFA